MKQHLEGARATGVRSNRLRLAAAALAVVIPLVGFATPSGAAPGRNDPNTPVSSDGSTAPPVSAQEASASLGSFAGGGAGTVNNRSKRVPDVPLVDPLTYEPIAGSPTTESVLGADTRVQNTTTTSFPNRAVAHITFSPSAGKTAVCTGWLINATTIATAGHCVAKGGSRAFYPLSSYRIYPGRNGSVAPYGSCTAKRLNTVSAWINSNNWEYDYAAIKLNCSIGNTTGWFGFWSQSTSLTGQTQTITGYPDDKASGTQWRGTGVVKITQTRKLWYDNDTFGGQSGSPVWKNNPPSPSTCVGACAMAIHTNGRDPSNGFNSGLRITSEVFNNLVAWRNAA
jgi:glutamyl endopeptidase